MEDYDELGAKLNSRLSSSGVRSSRTGGSSSSHRLRSSEVRAGEAAGAASGHGDSHRDDNHRSSSSRTKDDKEGTRRIHNSTVNAEGHRASHDGENDRDRERRHRERAERTKSRGDRVLSSRTSTSGDRDNDRERVRDKYRESERGVVGERSERSERDRSDRDKDRDRDRDRRRERDRDSRRSTRASEEAKPSENPDNDGSTQRSSRTRESSRREGESVEDAERRRRRRERERERERGERGEKSERDRERDREHRRRERDKERSERVEGGSERDKERRHRSRASSSRPGEYEGGDGDRVRSSRTSRSSGDRDRDRDRDRENRSSRSSRHPRSSSNTDDVTNEQFASMNVGAGENTSSSHRQSHSASNNPITAIPPPRERRSKPQSADFENFVVASGASTKSSSGSSFDNSFTVGAATDTMPNSANEFDDETTPQRASRRQQMFETFDEAQAAAPAARSTTRRSKWEELTAGAPPPPRSNGDESEEDNGGERINDEHISPGGSRHQSASSDGRRSRRSTRSSGRHTSTSVRASGRLSGAAALVAAEFTEDQINANASGSYSDQHTDDHSITSHEEGGDADSRRQLRSSSNRPGLEPILSARVINAEDGDTGATHEKGQDPKFVPPQTYTEVGLPSSNEVENEKDGVTNPPPEAEDEDENWALKVRLLSAVDLPPYLTPAAPLCPIVKFGIITDPELAVECQKIVDNQMHQMSEDSSGDEDDAAQNASVRLPHSTDERNMGTFTVSDEATKNANKICDFNKRSNRNKKSSILIQKQHLATSESSAGGQDRMEQLGGILTQLGIDHIPFEDSDVRFTTGQIVLSKTDNGTAEFQEEIRWDGMRFPMAMTLVLELCARPLPQLPGASGASGPGTLGGTGNDTQVMESFRTLRTSLLRTKSGEDADIRSVPGVARPLTEEGEGETRSAGGGVLPEWNTRKSGGNSLVPPIFSVNDCGASVSNVSAITSATTVGTGTGITMSKSSTDSPNKSLDPSVLAMNAMNAKLRRETEELARKQAVVDDESTVASGFSSPDLSSKARRIEDLQEKYSKHGRSNLLGGLFKQRGGRSDRSGSSLTDGKNEDLESATAAAAVARFLMENKGKTAEDFDPSYLDNEDDGSHAGSAADGPQGGALRSEEGAFSTRRANISSAGWVEEGESSDDEGGGRKSRGRRTAGESRRRGASTKQQPYNENNSPLGDDEKEQGEDNIVDDVRLATLLIPLSRLPFDNAGEKATISRWYSMDAAANSSFAPTSGLSAGGTNTTRELVMNHKRSPSVLLELSFSSTKALDDSEDEMEGDEGGALLWGDGEESAAGTGGAGGPGQGGEFDKNGQGKPQVNSLTPKPKPKPKAKKRKDKKKRPKPTGDPALEHGLIDFACVLGPKSIGSQRNDDGSKGWVESNPEVTVLERWPKNDEFHGNRGRYYSILPNMAEWFSFPEGSRLWRGTDPPTHFDLKPRSSSSTPSASISAFDACLKCASSFSWFVISSTGEDYGSRNIKTVGAVIRFFAPAPFCIDLTQDDYAQFHTMGIDDGGVGGLSADNVEGSGGEDGPERSKQCAWSLKRKRLWVPLAICLTSTYPIVGILEAMLLRLGETLAYRAKHTDSFQTMMKQVHIELANIIVNCSCPIPGVLHCSVPFLSGERLHVTLPPPTGLPPLPHGSCVTSVCRLLGAEGLTTLLAAVLTECKILIHSSDIANLAMVAEVVVGALIYPFSWALPYIPVLPEAMLEFIEAPLSYFLGVPSSVMKFIDPQALKDVVVFDLDQAGSPDYFDGGRRDEFPTKRPTPLPASMSSSITKAVFRLLREEEEVEDQYYSQSSSYNAARRHFPRLEAESLAEREFRVAVARQVCGLMRGYQECLFFVSSNQPVFNRDRFLRNAPALFEQRRGSMTGGSGSRATTVLSPRAKRFLSLMVNTQHFHQLLERLDFDDTAFFHEVMDTYDAEENADATSAIGSPEDAIKQLCDTLQKVEDKIPTYRVDRYDDMQRKAFSRISPELVPPWEREGRGGLSSLEENEDDNQNDLSSGGGGGGGDTSNVPNFVQQLLLPISVPGVTSPAEPADKECRVSGDNSDSGSLSSGGGGTVDQSVTPGGGVKSLSVELLIELENNPWRYSGILEGIQNHTPSDEELKMEINEADPVAAVAFKKNLMEKECITLDDKLERVIYERKRITIKDAIGERRFRVYKLMLQQKALKSEDSSLALGDPNNAQDDNNMDLNSLLTVNQEDEGGLRFGNTEVLDLSGAGSGAGKKTPLSEEEEFQNQRDRDVVKRCLERAYEGAAQTRSATQFQRRSSNDAQQAGLNFHENGRDLIQEAEAALRNPSAQRFLVTVLSKRARLENQRRARRTGGGHTPSPSKSFKKGGDRASVSRLVPAAFECLVRLCCAMLEACLENQDYESAYTLLTHTAGFCTVKQESNIEGGGGGGASTSVTDEQKNSSPEDVESLQHQVIYMTARIGMHPIFADLRLWERVLQVHLQDRQQNLNSTGASAMDNKPSSAKPSPSLPVNKNDEYEAAVSTLYEMLAFGVPSEELARFATRVSEARGWFATEKGQALLVLARRLTVRRDDGSDGENPDGSGSVGTRDDKESSLGHNFSGNGLSKRMGAGAMIPDRTQREWEELAWAHPTGSSTPSRAGGRSLSYAGPGSVSTAGANAAGYSGRAAQLRMKYGHASSMDVDGPADGACVTRPTALGSTLDVAKTSDGCTVASDGVIEPHGYMGRSAITSLASFGASVVATGGLDGSVFLAHTLRFPEEMTMSDKNATGNDGAGEIRGVRVECGKDNGAVTCLAATKGAGYKQTAGAAASTQNSTVGEDEEFFAALEGCRVVAGTTGGALRVWSVKDIYASTAVLNNSTSDNRSTFGDDVSVDGSSLHSGVRNERDTHYVRTGQQSMANKLKWSLKGRALSGHRGGVSCVDVPSPIYRPDSLVSGGADGLIKLWSLRHASRRTARAGSANTGARGSDFGSSSASASSRVFARGEGGDKRSLANDAQETLSGHKGRVLCVKTAWHGDRLLSGGADKTVRLWDISTATGQPLQTLNGHTCWVTHAQYWGQNNIVSGSTDRSIALWDARSGTVPLFVLRFHKSPISDLLLGSRTDPLMVSSGGDGVIATWDFRKLASSKDAQKQANGGKAKVQTVRTPVATMTHSYVKKMDNGTRCCGAILLARGTGLYERSVVSASIDGYLKEWDVQSGKLHNQQSTNHTEAVSCLSTFAESDGLRRGKTSKSVSSVGGTITCSWDGTVRVKRLLLKSCAK